MAYCNLIRELDRGYGAVAFNYYDQTFRAHRQTQPLQWGRMHMELWVKANTMSLSAARAPPRTQAAKPAVCFNYNKESGCNYRNCRFAHVCSHCGKHILVHAALLYNNQRLARPPLRLLFQLQSLTNIGLNREINPFSKIPYANTSKK